MKAIIQENYDGIHGLVIRDIPDPAKGPLSAIIETKYTPVLPYDILTEEGKLKGMRPTKLPMVIGYGFGGRVKEVGGLRNSRLIGQKVIGLILVDQIVNGLTQRSHHFYLKCLIRYQLLMQQRLLGVQMRRYMPVIKLR
ncbi:hypothetical protein [Lentilactobacillus kisonensis]|uniref:hypothetical protein n=1 Tax=Lentilactobacillus kisonensis TaxID=481722 RepID=UPI000B1C77A3|nr:hypothetical protein [Lentilactobacillus kisonensis]